MRYRLVLVGVVTHTVETVQIMLDALCADNFPIWWLP